MRPESLKLFAKLMENGYITREQSPAYYEYYNDPEIASELAIMEQELDFTLYKTNGRLYLCRIQTTNYFRRITMISAAALAMKSLKSFIC